MGTCRIILILFLLPYPRFHLAHVCSRHTIKREYNAQTCSAEHSTDSGKINERN